MAISIARSDHQNRAAHVLGLFSLLLLIQRGGAREFKVGGSGIWAPPADANAQSYNQWAEKNRFQIGDTLLFVYEPGNDSVLHVSKDEYTNCNTATYLQKLTDGHTVFSFNHSGPYYFTSGIEDNCLKNEKLAVIVLADRSNYSSNSNQTTAAGAPSPSDSTGQVPSPAPSGEQSPSPPTGTVQINPSPAPVTVSVPANGASSIFMNFISSFGAFVCSSLLIVL